MPMKIRPTNATREWAERFKSWARTTGRRDEITIAQMELVEARFATGDGCAMACWTEAVRRLRLKYGDDPSESVPMKVRPTHSSGRDRSAGRSNQ